jgi:hypothetical protein
MHFMRPTAVYATVLASIREGTPNKAGTGPPHPVSNIRYPLIRYLNNSRHGVCEEQGLLRRDVV